MEQVEFENRLILSDEAKKKYLEKLIGKMIKILHLIEEEKNTDIDPSNFMYGQMIELNSANQLFNNELIEIIIKLNIIYKGYKELDFKEVKKQIFEIKNKINYMIKMIDDKTKSV